MPLIDRSAASCRLASIGVLLLLAAALPGQQRPVPISVAATSTVAVLPGDRLAGSVAWLLGQWFGALVDARPTADGAPPGRWQLRFSLTTTGRGMQLISELWERDRAALAHTSWLPPRSLGAVVTTAAGDGIRLWEQARGVPLANDLAPAPRHGAVLPASGLARLLQRPVAPHEVRAVAAYPGGILVHLPDGPIALDKQFALSTDTVVWLTWRDRHRASPAAWHTLHPLHDGRVVLVPEAGVPVVVDPFSERSSPLTAAPAQTAASTSAAPPALVAVTGAGTSVWYRPGQLSTRRAAPRAPDASVHLPRGNVIPTSVAASRDGTIWVFDPRERRIRAFAPSGGGELRQVLAVTPLLAARELGGVQALAVTADGHFLIGTRRAIWKLDRRGIPRWSLTLLRHEPRQRLPQAFSLTAETEGGAFLLLDRTSGSVHRFSEQPEPSATPLLTATVPPGPAAIAAALTASALRATDQAWQHHRPSATLLLLGAARRYLNQWRAADPLAEGAEERSAAIDRFTSAVEKALYSEPELTLQVAPDYYHAALGTYYEQHPFAVTIRNAAVNREPSTVEIGLDGTDTATPLSLPAMASGEEVVLPVQLVADPRHGSTDLPFETLLWLNTAPKSPSSGSLTSVPLTVTPGRCLPAEAIAARGGLANVAFLRWHLDTEAAPPAIVAPGELSPYRLVDGVARLADVVPAGRCATQSPAGTLAALSGSATDWALALASLLAQRRVPAALLLSDRAPVILLAGLEHLGHSVDPSVPDLAPAAARHLAEHLEIRARHGVETALASGPVWALLPEPAAVAGFGSGQAWSAAGAALAGKLLASRDTGWSLVFVAGNAEERPSAATRPQSPVQIVLPPGTERR